MSRSPLVALTLLLAALASWSGEAPSPAPVHDPAPDYFIVVTGGELLDGAYPDGHTHFLTRTLRPFGPRCVGALIVDDHRAEMLEALHFATNHASLILVTGGLGPTPNDITRETLSEFTGIGLKESEPAVAELERRFNQPRDQLRANLRRQCLVPERGDFLRNAHGTAVGLVFAVGGNTLVALPGPPRELEPMVRDELVPWLQSHFGLRARGASVTLRFVGVGQSQIDQTLKEKVGLAPDVIVTSLFEGGRVDFTFSLPGHGEADVMRLKQLEAGIRRQLGDFFYADDGSSLEQVVLRQLRARGAKLALAEVATGGALSATLHGAADAGAVVAGAFAAPTFERLADIVQLPAPHRTGAGNDETSARQLAVAAAAHAGADWALALGEARTVSGTTEVWLAIKAGERSATRRLTARELDAAGRAGLVTQALDQLRRLLRDSS